MATKRNKAAEGEIPVARSTRVTQRYEIEETIEAGLVLSGSEVKSCRLRRVDLEGSYASFDGDILVLHKMHIAGYDHAAGPFFGHEPKRGRKLLLNKREIEKIRGRLTMQGYTLVPVRVYFKNGWAKVELGLARGKKHEDNREAIKKELDVREAREAMQRGRR
jgi:SsrA-binding protein